MIAGTLSFQSESVATDVTELLFKSNEYAELKFYNFITAGFSGGYFFHSRLPYKESDCYLSDAPHDILVLISGSVYNSEGLIRACGYDDSLSLPGLVELLFLKEGPEFVTRLNGDFAIFLYRPVAGEAYLFRDHVGVRPLAFTINAQTLLFSSDVNMLCKVVAGGAPARLEYLLGYFKYIDRRMTPDSMVRRLPPGHYLHFSEKGARLNKYWYPDRVRENRRLSYEQALNDLRQLLIDAVKIRCASRFTAGAHVSSGLDSGIVTAMSRKGYSRQEKFYGFSWSPSVFSIADVKYDERDWVRRFCKQLAIEPCFSDLGPEGLIDIISSYYGNPELIYEQRTIDQAVAAGTNLIFSGWGGDEFISTGDRGVEQDLLKSFRFRMFFKRNPLRPFRKFVKNQLRFVVFPALGILDKPTTGSFAGDARYLKDGFKKSDRKALSDFYFHTSRRQVHLKMLRFYHLQQRCEEWMINGYRRGVEYRYPLLDYRIIEYMLKIPSEILCRSDQFRPLLRELGKGLLPEEIRLNYSKTDPVSWSYTRKLYKEASLMLTEEVSDWKLNPDLGFIDFELLEKDLRDYRSGTGVSDGMVLFRGLIHIKAVHEFTGYYRNKK